MTSPTQPKDVRARPTGTSTEQALRKLRKDAPELHAKVVAQEVTPHGAMVEAGFRRPILTVPPDLADDSLIQTDPNPPEAILEL